MKSPPEDKAPAIAKEFAYYLDRGANVNASAPLDDGSGTAGTVALVRRRGAPG
jgi:hypothetical protein